MSEKWVWSDDGELFNSAEFDTKELAIADAVAHNPDREHVDVGSVEDLTTDYVADLLDPFDVLEGICVRLYDELGDAAGDDAWAPLEEAQVTDLKQRLHAAVKGWLDETPEGMPNCCRVTNIERVDCVHVQGNG